MNKRRRHTAKRHQKIRKLERVSGNLYWQGKYYLARQAKKKAEILKGTWPSNWY